jgi:D-glycero-alpha-D-manno-heptose 1-phosphate guanylyltransferase
MQAVILAGGLGTRLKPITERIPKPMVSVSGKPFLEHQITLLKKNNIKDIVLCTGYLSERIESYFKDGAAFGVSIRYSHEPKPLGTGGALKNALPYLSDVFFLLNGDTFLDLDYGSVFARLNSLGVVGVMVAYDNSVYVAQGNVAVDGKRFVAEYGKKGGEGLTYVDAGVLVFGKKVSEYFPRGKKFSLEEDIYPKLIAERQLAAYTTSKRFYDMGTPERMTVLEEVLK